MATASQLRAGMAVTVEFVEDRPASVLFPDILEVHAQADSGWKPARLENGVEIMAPQFIKSGDMIRLDVQNLKYVDRAKGAGH